MVIITSMRRLTTRPFVQLSLILNSPSKMKTVKRCWNKILKGFPAHHMYVPHSFFRDGNNMETFINFTVAVRCSYSACTQNYTDPCSICVECSVFILKVSTVLNRHELITMQ